MTTVPRFDGETVTLGRQDYVLPPLSLRQVEKFQPRIDAYLKGAVGGDTAGLMIDVVHNALSRNYPQMTRDEVGDLLDLKNLQPVFMALLRQSGWAPAAEGGAEPGPEGNLQGQASLGTGSPSTPL